MTDFKLPLQVLHNGEWFDATVVHFFSNGRAVVVSGPAFHEVAVTFDHRSRGIRNTPPAAETVATTSHQVAINQLCDCLELLCSVQNGCPLAKYERDWTKAMKEADWLLDQHSTVKERP